LQTGLFGIHDRLGKLDKNEHPLLQLDRLVNWEKFRPPLEQIRVKKKKSSPGPEYYDIVENQKIKQGQVPQDWKTAKKRQKDTDARWTIKGGKRYYGYKNHISIDVKNKLIDASVHDSNVFEDLLDDSNSNRDVYADSAYRSKASEKRLKQKGYRGHLQRKGSRHKKLTELEKQGNRTRSRIRSRVEHIFGIQAMTAGSLILRTIGLVRARAKIGLENLAYNINRYKTLAGNGV